MYPMSWYLSGDFWKFCLMLRMSCPQVSQQTLEHSDQQKLAHLKLKYHEFAGGMVRNCLYEAALSG